MAAAAALSRPSTQLPAMSQRGSSPTPTATGFTAVNGRASPPRSGSPGQTSQDLAEVADRSPRPLFRSLPQRPTAPSAAHSPIGSGDDTAPSTAQSRSMEPFSSPPAKRKLTASSEMEGSITTEVPADNAVEQAMSSKRRVHSFDPILQRAPSPERSQVSRRASPPSPFLNGARDNTSRDSYESQSRNDALSKRRDSHVVSDRAGPLLDQDDTPSTHTRQASTASSSSIIIAGDRPAEPPQLAARPNGVSHNPQPEGKPARKRTFTNRTKTGCLTCRRRKKKCDEKKPHCTNCERGSFDCEGYAKNNWASRENAKPHIRLQAKPLFHQSWNGMSPASAPAPPEASRPAPSSLGNDARHGTSSQWPPTPPQYRTGETQVTLGPPTSAPFRPPHEPAPFRAEHPAPVQSPPALHRNYGPLPSPRHILNPDPNYHLHQQQSRAMPAIQQPPHIPSAPQPSPYLTNGRKNIQMSETEKMLNGDEYCALDATLVRKRSAIEEVLRNVNSNTRGIIGRERRAHFTQAITNAHRGPEPTPRTARVGIMLSIEPPFNCDYGFNLDIGDNVVIGQNCSIQDAGRVTIGHNTVIERNVMILTNEVPMDIARRQGIGAYSQARSVHIGHEVYIGAGCIIEPGAWIGDGAYIKPGSVIDDKPIDVKAVVSGNPWKLLKHLP